MFRWMGRTLASLVGIALTNYGLWIFLVNIIGAFAGTVYDPWWVLPIILLAGGFAATGGVLFVLSFWRDRFHTRSVRIWGVALVILGSLLPTTLTAILLAITLMMVPTLFVTFPSNEAETPVTSG